MAGHVSRLNLPPHVAKMAARPKRETKEKGDHESVISFESINSNVYLQRYFVLLRILLYQVLDWGIARERHVETAVPKINDQCEIFCKNS